MLIIFKYRKSAKQAVCHAINTAVLLDVKWIGSRFNRERLDGGKEYCRIRVGIGKGKLTLEEDVWNQGVTPEGYPIVQTKRIESNAKGELHQPHILVKGDLREDVEAIDGVELSDTYTIKEDQTKGIKAVKVFPIVGYDKLYNNYQQQIKTRNRAAKWFEKGYIAGVGDNPTEAERCFRKLIKLKPDFAEVWVNLGVVLWKQEKHQEAEEALRKAVELKPDYAEAWLNLGVSLYELKKYKESECCFHKAIELKPEESIIWSNLGELYEKQERIPEAIEAVEEALRLAPDNKNVIELLERLKKL